jgi:hypothetical protein
MKRRDPCGRRLVLPRLELVGTTDLVKRPKHLADVDGWTPSEDSNR